MRDRQIKIYTYIERDHEYKEENWHWSADSQNQSHRCEENIILDVPVPNYLAAITRGASANIVHSGKRTFLLKFWRICYKGIDNWNTILKIRVLQRQTFLFLSWETSCGNILKIELGFKTEEYEAYFKSIFMHSTSFSTILYSCKYWSTTSGSCPVTLWFICSSKTYQLKTRN